MEKTDSCDSCIHLIDGKCSFFNENGPPYGVGCVGYIVDHFVLKEAE